MILRLRSGSVTPLSCRRNSLDASTYWSSILKWLAENLLHHLRLARAQQAVVDKNARELITDGFVQQRRRHAGSTPPLKPRMTLSLPTCSRILLDRLLDDCRIVQLLPQAQTR